MIGSYISKIRSKPASIDSIPAATEMGDVDAVNTPLEEMSEGSQPPSRPDTPTVGAGGDGAMNRKQRRAEAKSQARKRK